MLAAVMLSFVTRHPDGWPDRPQGLVEGWLRAAIDETLGGVSTAIHDDHRPGPFTTAAWPGAVRGSLEVRVTSLDGLLARPVFGLFEAAAESGSPVRLGNAEGCIAEVTCDPARHALAGISGYDQLLAARPGGPWQLRFHSPTTFKTGDVEQPLPVPASLWGSWLRRWNDFAPGDLTFDGGWLRELDRYAWLSQLRIETTATWHRSGTRTGFVGDVTIAPTRRLPDDVRREMSVLARYAFYAGTGRDTVRGLGVTQWLNAPL